MIEVPTFQILSAFIPTETLINNSLPTSGCDQRIRIYYALKRIYLYHAFVKLTERLAVKTGPRTISPLFWSLGSMQDAMASAFSIFHHHKNYGATSHIV